MSEVANGSFDVPTSAEILESQDEISALRLLVAQRKSYRQAKVWSLLRTIGVAIVAVAARILTAVSPNLSVIAGATAATWIFLSRSLFRSLEQRAAHRGATFQEMFDTQVFAMPEFGARSLRVSPDDAARLTGSEAEVRKVATSERLKHWYPIEKGMSGVTAISLSQRANAAYSEHLLALHANVWAIAMGVWAAVALALSLVFQFSLANFLLGVALPVLPPLLDTFDEWKSVRGASKVRRDLAAGIEDKVTTATVMPSDLLIWQDQLFDLRRTSPQIPGFLYWGARRRNERVMKDVASRLAADAEEAAS